MSCLVEALCAAVDNFTFTVGLSELPGRTHFRKLDPYVDYVPTHSVWLEMGI